MHKLGPTGVGNPAPLWGARGVRPAAAPRWMGKNRSHLRLTFSAGRRPLNAVCFNVGEQPIPDGPLDLVFHLEENEYNGRTSLQLNLRDFAPASSPS